MMPMPQRVNLAICTIEKANNLLNQLIEENRLKEIGLVVVVIPYFTM
jgi:hypothetical protein